MSLKRSRRSPPESRLHQSTRTLETRDPENRDPETRDPEARDPDTRVPKEAGVQEAGVQEAGVREAGVQEVEIQEIAASIMPGLASGERRRASRLPWCCLAVASKYNLSRCFKVGEEFW